MSLDDLAATPRRVAEIVAGKENVRTRTVPDQFAIVEHLCHLRDIEREGYNVRIAQLLNEDDPLMRDLDGDALARERRYLEQDGREALRDFAAARERSVRLLRDLDAQALAREGTLENVGRVTLARLMELMLAHDRGHLEELAALAER